MIFVRPFKSLLNALFPPRCVFCDEINSSDQLVCETCRGNTNWIASPVIAQHFPKSACDNIWAAANFEGPIVQAIHRLKYERRPDLAKSLAKLLLELGAPSADIVMPVPMTAKRMRKRGYNQAELLSSSLARVQSAQHTKKVLMRTPGHPQVGLSAAERLANVKNCFTVNEQSGCTVSGRSVLLVDDVMTTGATLQACAKSLRKAGAAKIVSLVLAVKI